MATVRGLLVRNRPLQLRLLVGMSRSFRGTLALGGAQQRAGKLFPSPHSTRRRQSQAIPRQRTSRAETRTQRALTTPEGSTNLHGARCAGTGKEASPSGRRTNWIYPVGPSCIIHCALKKVIQRSRGRESSGGVPSGAHGATNKEHQVCARRRAGEAAGSPLRIVSTRERRWGPFSAA